MTSLAVRWSSWKFLVRQNNAKTERIIITFFPTRRPVTSDRWVDPADLVVFLAFTIRGLTISGLTKPGALAALKQLD